MLSKASRMLVVAAAAVGLAVTPGAARAETYRVKATDSNTWSPDFRHTVKGNRIVWKNPTDRKHTLHAYGGNWSKSVVLAAGERTRKTFKKAGVFKYRCKIHSTLSNGECDGMCGVIHVTSS